MDILVSNVHGALSAAEACDIVMEETSLQLLVSKQGSLLSFQTNS